MAHPPSEIFWTRTSGQNHQLVTRSGGFGANVVMCIYYNVPFDESQDPKWMAYDPNTTTVHMPFETLSAAKRYCEVTAALCL